MPQIVVSANEIANVGGVPTNTGPAFIAGVTDAGPPVGGPTYVKCLSLADYVAAFGPRSSTSATVYDWLDELFHDGGSGAIAYVTRVSDSTATSATLTLNDGLASPKPTVVVTAATPGAEGNDTFVTVTAGSGATFTATTATSTALTAISSFKNIGVGTPISGTGIPAGTYIASVNTGASSAVLSQATTASASGVTITPGNVTVTITVEDGSGNVIETDSHGPYYLTSQLFADTSPWVTFTQSAASGFTVNLPAALTITALTGGANANDLSDTSHVNALANFPASLGPGTVALPGKTSTTCWNGLDAHALANNRFAVKDMADNTSASGVVSAATVAGYTPTTYGAFIQGSLVLPGVQGSGTTRTVPGSAGVAALRAQVSVTGNQNQMPCGKKWPLVYPQSFTTFYGPAVTTGGTPGPFSETDVDTLWAAGVNVFANFYGVPCLYGFFTPVPKSTDPVYWQASCAVERMNLVGLGKSVLANYLFDDITQSVIDALDRDLVAVCLRETTNGAISTIKPDGTNGTTADAFAVLTAPPVNTPSAEQAGGLNAQIQARLTPSATKVTLLISVVPLTQAIPQPTTTG